MREFGVFPGDAAVVLAVSRWRNGIPVAAATALAAPNLASASSTSTDNTVNFVLRVVITPTVRTMAAPTLDAFALVLVALLLIATRARRWGDIDE